MIAKVDFKAESGGEVVSFSAGDPVPTHIVESCKLKKKGLVRAETRRISED